MFNVSTHSDLTKGGVLLNDLCYIMFGDPQIIIKKLNAK